MLPGYILALREGLEAALVIGIVFSVLAKMNQKQFGKNVWLGVISGVIVSFMVAVVLNRIGMEFEGKGEQIFEGVIMLLAACVLTWMVFWMHKQSGALVNRIEANIERSVASQGQGAIFILAFVAVVREGIELAIFLLAIRLEINPFETFFGALLGVVTAVLVGVFAFSSAMKLSLTWFFRATNVVLALFAAGLVGLGIHELNELGWVPEVIEHVWNLNSILPEQSAFGQLLRGLVGYDGDPSFSMVAGYFGYYLLLAALIWIRSKKFLVKND